jgi:transcriptional regulator with XRE-family HTH domain
MITNEKQYKITKAQADKLLEAFEQFDENALASQNIHPKLIEAQKQALYLEHKQLVKQLKEYEGLKSGEVQYTQASSIQDLPLLLIKSRIAQGLTQAELAKKIGMPTQQVQRYEADAYATISFRKLSQIADALGVEFRSNADVTLIAMTLRHDRTDNFWFVLLHELGHILMHINLDADAVDKDSIIFDDLDESLENDSREDEANEFARNSLISQEHWDASPVSFIWDAPTIIQQAKNWGVSPSIVAGRIIKENDLYKNSPPELRKLQGESKVRHLFNDI